MKKSQEIKVLKQVIEVCTNTNIQIHRVKNFAWGCRISGFVGITLSIILLSIDYISNIAGVLIGAFSGIAIGMAIYAQIAINQYPIIAPYIDVDGLQKQLSELES